MEERLAGEPFRAPEADELADLKLGPKEVAAAVRVGRLVKIADGVVLGPDALDRAAETLATLVAALQRQLKSVVPLAPPAASPCRCWSNSTHAVSRDVPTTAPERWFDLENAV